MYPAIGHHNNISKRIYAGTCNTLGDIIQNLPGGGHGSGRRAAP